MLRIGRLEINGEGKWPRSRVAMKAELRDFARELGLELRFVTRKKKTASWCHIVSGRARVCEGVRGEIYSMTWIVFSTLHEIAHWIQFNEGMFQRYFGKPYYEGWHYPKVGDVRELVLRVERHADWMAKRLAKELFGACLVGIGSIYDKEHEEAAREFIDNHYGI